MNNRKSIVFLLFAIALMTAANILFRRDGFGTAAVRFRHALVDETLEVSRLVLERSGAARVTMEKAVDWRLVEPFAGNADERTVLKVFDSLAFTPVSDVISDADLLKLGRSRADFVLTDPVLSVTVSDGVRSTTVSFGGPTPTADGVYAAIEGTDAVFIVPADLFASVDRSADDFRRRSLFSLGLGAVSSFDIKRGTGAILSFAQDESGWRLGTERASEQRVRKFLSDLLSATAVDFVWPVGSPNELQNASGALLALYGLEPESAVTVTLKGTDGADRQVSFGKNAGEKLSYAFVQNGTAIVTLPVGLRDEALQDRMLFTDSRLFATEAKSVGFFSIADNTSTCVLCRDGNGVWNLESPVVAPADPLAVEAILGRLVALTAADVTTDKSGLGVSLTTNAAPVLVLRESLLGSDRLDDLRSRAMVSLDPLLVKRIVRTSGKSGSRPTSVVYARDRRSWNVESAEEGATVDEKGVASVLSALNPLQAVRVEKLQVSANDLDAYELAHPFLTVAIDQDRDDAVRRNILIGGKTDGGRFATVGSSDAVFVISDETVARLAAEIVGK